MDAWEQDKSKVAKLLGEPDFFSAKFYAIASREQPKINRPITHIVDSLNLTRYRSGPRAGQLWLQQFNLREIPPGLAELLLQEWNAATS
jgi:hypothetical protein